MSEGDGPTPTQAFISYAHDSDEHRSQVRRLWYFLRNHGVDAWCDLDVAEERQEWPRLIESEMDRNAFILIIASPEYRERADRQPGNPHGRGVEYEAALIRERLYGDRSRWFARILPVVLPGRSSHELPDFLLPRSATVYYVREFTVAGAERLLRALTRQMSQTRPPLGPVPPLPQQPAPTDERSCLIEELIQRLRTLPGVQTPAARATFVDMVAERLASPLAVPGQADLASFLRELVATLAPRPGGLVALADVVRALHRNQAIEHTIRRLIERIQMLG